MSDEFIELVAKMRHAQKEYFRTRSDSAMDKAVSLERQVDRWLKDDQNHQQRLEF